MDGADAANLLRLSVRSDETGTCPICLSGLSAALNANQFVIAPEGAVEEQHVSGFEFLQQESSICGTAGM